MSQNLPLAGIKVLDASHVLAGPFATWQLSLAGAEIVKVERQVPKDFIRKHGGTDAMRERGLGASFASQNAGKKSIGINLKDPRGVEIFKKLTKESDVLVENFRPGVMDRLGLGWDQLRGINPSLIYCSLTGFGANGPLAGDPAYDHIVQGMSGLMSMTGTPESGPLRVGIAITDYIVGLNAAFAITTALHQRANTGKGQHLDVSMLDSMLAMMGASVAEYQATGAVRGLEGNLAFSGSPFSGGFNTKAGMLVITANTGDQGRRMAALLDRPDLAEYADLVEEGKEITDDVRRHVQETILEALGSDRADGWEPRFSQAGIPASKVRSLPEILSHPHIEARGALHRLDVPGAPAELNLPGLGFKSDRWTPGPLGELPRHGQHTAKISESLGLSQAEIETLAREGALGGVGLPRP